jgi:hypothetical protein
MKKYFVRVKEERNILCKMKRQQGYLDHILRRNCLLKDVTEVKIERTDRGGIRRKQLLDDNKETRI